MSEGAAEKMTVRRDGKQLISGWRQTSRTSSSSAHLTAAAFYLSFPPQLFFLFRRGKNVTAAAFMEHFLLFSL